MAEHHHDWLHEPTNWGGDLARLLNGHRLSPATGGTAEGSTWRCSCGESGTVNSTRDMADLAGAAHVETAVLAWFAVHDAERLTKALGCHPGTRENDGTPCASGLHSPALWGADGCTWVAEVAECLGELS